MNRLNSVLLALALLVPSAAQAQSQETVIYYHTDAIGSVRMITDANGQVVGRYDFSPFGQDVPQAPPPPADARQFAGKERDAATELDYFGARDYQGLTGRFTAVDPVVNVEAAVVDPQRWNRFAYVANRPLQYVDPDGRDPVTIGLALWAAFEIASTAYDAYTTYSTFSDPSSTAAERAAAGGGLFLGMMSFGGGYGTIGKAALQGAETSIRISSATATGIRAIGKYPQYLELAEEIGAKRFNIPANVWERMSDAEKIAANNKFLDRGISLHDTFVSTHRISDVLKTKGFSWLRHEIEYLLNAGYRVAEDGYTLISR